MARILVVDDDRSVAWAFERCLSARGHEVATAPDAAAALAACAARPPDLVLLDVMLPGTNGLDLLRRLRHDRPALPVIIVTAHGSLDTAIRAVQEGARDYLTKPVEVARLELAVDRALETARLSREVEDLRSRLGGETLLVGKSPPMQEVFKQVAAVAGSEATVLIEGESGVGKECVARALHRHSGRREGPFEPLNCAAFPESLLESELFGYEPGAFTDARRRKEGKLEAARGGTLFLDEIAEIPAAVQAKLLRVLEDKVFSRLGGNEKITGDFRLLAATNKDLDGCLAGGRFREDLYYRVKVVTIRVPPLRERREDIPLLVAHFLERSGASSPMGEEAMRVLVEHGWPGNVRELKNAVDHGVVLARGGAILPEHLPPLASRRGAEGAGGEAGRLFGEAAALLVAEKGAQEEGVYYRALALFERPLIERVLARTGGNQVHAARILGLHRTTLRTKMQEHGIGKENDEGIRTGMTNEEKSTNDSKRK